MDHDVVTEYRMLSLLLYCGYSMLRIFQLRIWIHYLHLQTEASIFDVGIPDAMSNDPSNYIRQHRK
jgi:hypothetical protein